MDRHSSAICFGASWGKTLKISTTICVVLLLAIAMAGLTQRFEHGALFFIAMVLVPVGLLIAGAFFVIRGYELSDENLRIIRLGWNSTLNLSGLQSVEVDPQAMDKSLRLFGNGGLFCFAGKFRNKKLGPYRAFATDSVNAVVLKFQDSVVVVTPDDTERFVAELSERALPELWGQSNNPLELGLKS